MVTYWYSFVLFEINFFRLCVKYNLDTANKLIKAARISTPITETFRYFEAPALLIQGRLTALCNDVIEFIHTNGSPILKRIPIFYHVLRTIKVTLSTWSRWQLGYDMRI
jgi:hypothetical protein